MMATGVLISLDVFDALEEICLLADKAGVCLYANPAATALAPQNQQPLTGKPVADILAAIGADADTTVTLTRALQKHISQRFQLRYGMDNTANWFEVVIAPVDEGCLIFARDISRRRKMETTYERWGKILEQAEFGVAIGSADGTTLELVNPAYARMHGYSVEELTGKPIAAVYPPFRKPEIPPNIEKNHRAGHRRFETEHIHRDGHVFPVEVDATTVRDESGKVEYRIVTAKDITEQAAAREELRLRKEYFQRTFDNAPSGIAIADLDGRYLAANAAMCRMVGYSEEELKRITYRDITHPEDVAENDRQRDCLLHNQFDSFQMEKRYVCKDGKVVWALMVVSTIKGLDGKALVSVGQMLNIDQQKRAEEALRESEARLKKAQLIAHICEWRWDIGHDRVEFLGPYAEVLGLSTSNTAHSSMQSLLGKLGTDDYSRVTAIVDRSITDRLPFEFEICTRAGTHAEHSYLIHGEPEITPSGEMKFFHGTTQDITQSKKHELEVIRSHEQVRALAAYHERMLEEERKRIAREIHDELGQQLSSLKLEISLLRQRHGGIADILESADTMRDTVNKSISVVRQVASALRPAALDLGIVAAIEWLASEFTSRWGIDCKFDPDGEDIQLSETQAIVAFRVVQESLTNVARHANARHVAIHLRREGNNIHLHIRDDGKGFDIASANAKGGYGLLGMRERLHTLGGTINIDSAPNQGTAIMITFPLESR